MRSRCILSGFIWVKFQSLNLLHRVSGYDGELPTKGATLIAINQHLQCERGSDVLKRVKRAINVKVQTPSANRGDLWHHIFPSCKAALSSLMWHLNNIHICPHVTPNPPNTVVYTRMLLQQPRRQMHQLVSLTMIRTPLDENIFM